MRKILLLFVIATTVIACNKKKADDARVPVPDKFTCAARDSILLTHDNEWPDWVKETFTHDTLVYLDTPARVFTNALIARKTQVLTPCDIEVALIKGDVVGKLRCTMSLIETSGNWEGSVGGPFSTGFGTGIGNSFDKTNKCYRMYIAMWNDSSHTVVFKSHFDFDY